MIDLTQERAISLPEAARMVPPKGVHLSTLYRWFQHGIRGIRLETAMIGGKRVTSEEALDRFFRCTSESSGGVNATSSLSVISRQRQCDAAERLKAAGI